jgi:hypothetical protein
VTPTDAILWLFVAAGALFILFMTAACAITLRRALNRDHTK